MADLIIDVYQGSNRKCLAIGNHRISAGKAYGFLEKVESYRCDTKDILSCIWNINRWIQCSERLPETNTQVLCYCRMGDFRIMEFDEQENRWYEGIHDYRLQSVTHWMPLPEPPEEVQDDE